MQAPYFGPSLVKNEVLASSTFGGCLCPFGGDPPSLLLVPGVVDQVEAPNYTIGGNVVADPINQMTVSTIVGSSASTR